MNITVLGWANHNRPFEVLRRATEVARSPGHHQTLRVWPCFALHPLPRIPRDSLLLKHRAFKTW